MTNAEGIAQQIVTDSELIDKFRSELGLPAMGEGSITLLAREYLSERKQRLESETAPVETLTDDASTIAQKIAAQRQPFEDYPELAAQIEYLANKMMNVSVVTWSEFLASLNAAISTLKDERDTAQVELMNVRYLYETLTKEHEEIEAERDALREALRGLHSSAAMAGNILFNIAQDGPPLTDRERETIAATRKQLDLDCRAASSLGGVEGAAALAPAESVVKKESNNEWR